MNLKSAIKEVKLKLGGEGIVYNDLELGRSQFSQIVQYSLRELSSTIDVPAEVTVPYQDVIDLSKYKIDSIFWIVRAEPKLGSVPGAGVTDPFYASSIAIANNYNRAGATYSAVLRTQLNYLMASMAQNTIQSDLAWQTNYYAKTLKVTYSGIRPNELTIFYRPIIDHVEDLPSRFWYDYVIRLAVAHSKIIIGQIRSKFTVNSAPIQVNGDILADGKAELEQIRTELREICRGLAVR